MPPSGKASAPPPSLAAWIGCGLLLDMAAWTALCVVRGRLHDAPSLGWDQWMAIAVVWCHVFALPLASGTAGRPRPAAALALGAAASCLAVWLGVAAGFLTGLGLFVVGAAAASVAPSSAGAVPGALEIFLAGTLWFSVATLGPAVGGATAAWAAGRAARRIHAAAVPEGRRHLVGGAAAGLVMAFGGLAARDFAGSLCVLALMALPHLALSRPRPPAPG